MSKLKLSLKKQQAKLILLSLVVIIIYSIVPTAQFTDPYSQIVYDKEAQLLGAKIAEDGQWRFPLIDSVPKNFEIAILTFEDKRFYKHFGVDFLSVMRAIKQNLKAKRIVSGASTLTMQVARMSRAKNSRSFLQKFIEIFIAFKTELKMSKNDILRIYASHAPMGGNVIGLEAASWRYFSKSPYELSLAEAATLAVLPNAPSIIHPGKNRASLKRKRNYLLNKLHKAGHIDSLNLELAILEEIPKKPKPLPQKAPHFLELTSQLWSDSYSKKTTIDSDIQAIANRSAANYSLEYQQSDIQNLGIIVLDTETGNVLAYVGNSPNTKEEKDVDMIQAKRSSGSVLKPILYAHALDEGLILPNSIVRDVPLQFAGYKPKNYNRKHHGAIRINEALSMSLNIPAVDLLQKYNVEKFLSDLKDHGFTSFDKPAGHYGLSLILGGGEVSLWELTGAYASMARTLMHYKKNQSRYSASDIHPPKIKPSTLNHELTHEINLLSAGAIHHAFEAMQKVSRPNAEGDWESFSSTQNISWKTGTSYGHRDAWAVGVSPEYTIGVWVGNSDGEGKHNLIGVSKAAPILFDVFNQFEQVSSFDIPHDDFVETRVCNETGFLAGPNCEHIDTVNIVNSNNAKLCPYHIKINIDKQGYLVNSNCCNLSDSKVESYLVFPANMALYYRQNHPEYKLIPQVREDCTSASENKLISFIYPTTKTKIYLPTNHIGEKERAVFKVAHQIPKSKLYWHLNQEYIGSTDEEHSMDIYADVGDHKVIVIDNKGNTVSQNFEVIGL